MPERSILVVDDDPAILATIAEILELEGYDVLRAGDGAEALRALDACKANCPALVVLDMRMPIVDGWAFAEELRQRGLATPILLMTAAPGAAEWVETIGAQGVLAKPFELNDLLDAVARLTIA
ncbi:MAG: hypothetical protein QOF51_3968 [Chloroflexota bacterium]|nr:hypothetical protein [Chloroflexota bacterium]